MKDGSGKGPYIRFVPNPVTLIWEAGWEGDFDPVVREAAGKQLEMHLALPVVKHRAGHIVMLQNVIEGKRPIFLIEGRNPTTKDVEELRRRDHAYRHNLDAKLAEMLEAASGESDEDRNARISRTAHELADDRVLYGLLTSGRHSVVVPGLKGVH